MKRAKKLVFIRHCMTCSKETAHKIVTQVLPHKNNGYKNQGYIKEVCNRCKTTNKQTKYKTEEEKKKHKRTRVDIEMQRRKEKRKKREKKKVLGQNK